MRKKLAILGFFVATSLSIHAQPIAVRDKVLNVSPSLFEDVRSVVADSTKLPKIHDPWLGFDKVQHFTFSFLFTLGQQYLIVNKIGATESQALPYSISSTAAIGLFKEIYDKKRSPSRHFSKRDLVADALGIAVATLIIRN